MPESVFRDIFIRVCVGKMTVEDNGAIEVNFPICEDIVIAVSSKRDRIDEGIRREIGYQMSKKLSTINEQLEHWRKKGKCDLLELKETLSDEDKK